MRLAIIADIHSNLPALEAVLDDLSRQPYDQLIHLGDAFNGPIAPQGVADALRQIPMVHVSGNGERMILDPDPSNRSTSASFARERLDANTLQWIGTWPQTYLGDGYLACHASPRSDLEYLIDDISEGFPKLRNPEDIAERLETVTAGLVLIGHTHLPRYVRVSDCLAVLNPGSVGLPAYEDTAQVPHIMQVGSPDARYAIAEKQRSGAWRISFHLVPYDVARAASAARDAGFPAWARILETGYNQSES